MEQKTINISVLKESLEASLIKAEETWKKYGRDKSPVALISDVTDCVLPSLKASSHQQKEDKTEPRHSRTKGENPETWTNILKANGGST